MLNQVITSALIEHKDFSEIFKYTELVYITCFNEMIRQVSFQSKERGLFL